MIWFINMWERINNWYLWIKNKKMGQYGNWRWIEWGGRTGAEEPKTRVCTMWCVSVDKSWSSSSMKRYSRVSFAPTQTYNCTILLTHTHQQRWNSQLTGNNESFPFFPLLYVFSCISYFLYLFVFLSPSKINLWILKFWNKK